MNVSHCSRRDFLKATGLSASGLILGFRAFTPRAMAGSPMAVAAPGSFAPNAFIAISAENGVTLAISCPEIGQNIRTAFAMILGDELGADLGKVRLHQAEPRGDMGRQTAGGSGSVRSCFTPLREAAATAREMLVAAAATRWGIPASSCRTENGFVIGPDSRTASFESLAADAANQPVPSSAPLKPASEFTYIGKAIRCLDTLDIVTGKTRFGIDALPEGCAFAVMLRSPVSGGSLKSFDASAVKAMPGVRDVVQIGDKVAVIASNTWSAINASRAVRVDWEPGGNSSFDTGADLEARQKAARNGGNVVLEKGDFEAAFEASPNRIDQTFFCPTITHVPLEPPNGTAWFSNGKAEIWGSSQTLNNLYRDRIAKRGEDLPTMTGLPHEKITYHQMRIGGGFGRKLANDYVQESIEIAKQVGYPVKMIFTREDDIRHGRYRLPELFRYRAALHPDGSPQAIEESLTKGMPKKNRGNPSDVMKYFAIQRRRYSPVSYGIPGGALRAPGHNTQVFAEQSLVDIMAVQAGIDSLDYQLALHGDPATLKQLGWKKAPRNEPVICDLLRRVREESGWKQDSSFGYGVAVFSGYGSHCALVALAPKKAGKRPIEKVFTAVHCGQVINPLGARAQIEGGIIDCLSATLYQRITVAEGKIRESNFHDYRLLRMGEDPEVSVSLVDSNEPPQGLGEVSYPPTAAAATAAIFAATGKRHTELPVRA